MERHRPHSGDTGAGSTIGPESFAPSSGSRPAPRARAAAELHVCPGCGCELVYPVDWEPAAGRAWRVRLRCPGCEWSGGGEYSQDVVDRFDDALDSGTTRLLEDLHVITRANMEDDVERLIAAIHADAILPEDF
jgi:hypothetical protein